MTHPVARCVSVCLLVTTCATGAAQTGTWKADNGNGTFSNPLFYDEFSDCDLIRVGRDFYLTGTTMHSMPGLPILHSRDLVNWRFVAYALDRLDLGPAFRLEQGQNVYGQGIWAPSFRYHKGVFYIFSNVNGQTTQLFRATNPAGPWTRTAMKRSFHDVSALFDADDKAYVVWGYRGIRLAQLTDDLLDVVPGTEREIIAASAGMGEGLHLYKIRGKYYLTSAWFLDEMRMPTARADRLTGPWEVNQDVSRGEDFGFAEGYRMDAPPGAVRRPPFHVRPGNPESPGRLAIHQGGIVDTPTGEWWGFSMMDANSVGRLTTLSPVTWKQGWPYFGLPNNLGRSPRIWVKPRTGVAQPPTAPYERSDRFSAPTLQPIWQWNHVPADGRWSLTERRGYLRLHALKATDLLTARNTLTQRAIGPRSTPTVVMDASGLKPGDVAGVALFNRPYAWIGVVVDDEGPALTYVTEELGPVSRVPLRSRRVWLRAACDFLNEQAEFSYSTDGRTFQRIGEPFRMVFQLLTFQGVRYALFSFSQGEDGGFADFDAIEIEEPSPRGLMRPIPYGQDVRFVTDGAIRRWWAAESGDRLQASEERGTGFTVVDRALGRVALRSAQGFVSTGTGGRLSIRKVTPGISETFQWIETFTGELILMSLATHRYVRLDGETGGLRADSRGPHPNRRDGVRWDWHVAPSRTELAPRVDHHQHLFSPAIVARSSDIQSIDAAQLVRMLDAAGIHQAIVLSLAYQYGNPNRTPVENEYELVKAENDWTSGQVARFPDRLRGFCSVNPLKEYAVEEIARCANDPRLRLGLKLHFGNSDVDLGNVQHVERLREVFGAANRYGMAIIVHMRSTISRNRSYGAGSARVFLNRVLPAAPDVPVQIAHLAGAGGYDDPLVDEAVAVFVEAIAKGDARMRRVYFDVTSVAGLGQWKAKGATIAARIRDIGVTRILFGSDGAVRGNATPAEAWAAFRQLPLSEAELRTIATNIAPYTR